jgi:hypothetical protein
MQGFLYVGFMRLIGCAISIKSLTKDSLIFGFLQGAVWKEQGAIWTEHFDGYDLT